MWTFMNQLRNTLNNSTSENRGAPASINPLLLHSTSLLSYSQILDVSRHNNMVQEALQISYLSGIFVSV